MKFIFAFMLVVLETVGGCLHVYGQTRDTLNVADSVVYDTVAIETGTSEICYSQVRSATSPPPSSALGA